MGEKLLFHDLDRIEYTVDHSWYEESSYRIFDFAAGSWRVYARDYGGTRWFECAEAPPVDCLRSVRDALAPVATILGIALTDALVRTNTPKTLLAAHGKVVENGFIKTTEQFYPYLNRTWSRVRPVTVIRLDDGRYVHILGSEEWAPPPGQMTHLVDTDVYVNQDFAATCHLVIPDFDAVNAELIEYFGRHPDELHTLDWRKLEELIEAIFRNQGYRTELGRGWNDKGVDLRLIQKDSIGEVVTLVQVKRYSPHRPVRLEAVAALYGVVEKEAATRGLFVTTSRYLPSARAFAQERSRRLALASPEEVGQWCRALGVRR